MQTFRELREQNCYYVDKTPYIERLLHEGKHYFLSRPRRFGKSLFLDTLKELFEGSEELFEGLHIHARHNWSQRHPVVRLSFGGGSYTGPDVLEANVMEQLAAAERRLGVVSEYLTAAGRFAYLLEAHDCAGLRELFHAFFASIPYQWYTGNDIADYEGFYASVFYSYFAALGYDITVEESTSHGRLDMAVRAAGHVYLFEFKVAEMAPPGFRPRSVAGAPLRRQVPRHRRPHPPGRRRVEPHHPQHHRLRNRRRLNRRPAGRYQSVSGSI